MDHEQNDQLLSAYLDGELSADERAHVEQLLATSAEARQLVEELKAIRAGLQSLPQHRLEPNFAQQVLRRAKQESRVSPAKIAILPQHDSWHPSVFRSRRGIVWSLMAVAAAVIIMVATRHEEQPVRQVAKAPSVQQEANGPQPAENKVAQQLAVDQREQQLQPGAAAPMSLAKDETSSTQTGNRLSRSPAAPQQSQPSGNLVPQMRSNVAAARSSSDGMESFGAAPQSRGGGLYSKKQAAAAPSLSDSNPVLIVQIGLKQQPAARNDFEQVLANNRIALEVDHDKTRDEADRKSDSLAAQSAPSSDVDVLYVETSPEQLTAVLQELTKSKSLLSVSTNLSPPLPIADKEATPSSRARRIDALHDWVARNLDNLPQTISLSEKPATGAAQSSLIDEVRMKTEEVQGSDAAASSPAPSTLSPAPPETAHLYLKKALSDEPLAADKANPPPLVRALFVLRSVDSAASTSSAGKAAGADQSAPASTPAAEKQ